MHTFVRRSIFSQLFSKGRAVGRSKNPRGGRGLFKGEGFAIPAKIWGGEGKVSPPPFRRPCSLAATPFHYFPKGSVH